MDRATSFTARFTARLRLRSLPSAAGPDTASATAALAQRKFLWRRKPS